MAKVPNGERVLAFKGDSLESLAGLISRGLTSSFDAVYVDASHEVSERELKKADGTHGSTAQASCVHISFMPSVDVVSDAREATRSAVRTVVVR